VSEILLRAPATIANFGPGFDVFALALAGPHDYFRIRRTGEEGGAARIRVKITDGGDPLPTEPEKNTAGLAAIHFFKETGARGGAEIEIVKKMPIGSGLGSSAASAVAAVFGLNRLYAADLGESDLIEIASRGEAASGGTPHADNVAACCLGGFVIIRSRHPLRIDRLDAPAFPVVVRVRRKSLITSRGLIPDHLPLARVKEQMAWCAAVVHAVATGDVPRIGEAINRDHISEPVRSSYIGGYADLKARALEAGALGFNVSGGGSSVFAICPADRAERVAEVMRTPEGGPAGEGGAPPLVFVTASSNVGVESLDRL
jgi:homoserine kinase